MRRWIVLGVLGAALSVLGLVGCEEEEGALETPGESTDVVDETEEAETAVSPSAGAAQHPPPEPVEVEPGELPEDRVAGAAQHPLPGSAPEEAVE